MGIFSLAPTSMPVLDTADFSLTALALAASTNYLAVAQVECSYFARSDHDSSGDQIIVNRGFGIQKEGDYIKNKNVCFLPISYCNMVV